MVEARFVWDDAAVAALRRWRAEGATTGEIIARFAARGDAPSRNAVLGKAHRLGLPAAERPVWPDDRADGAPRPRRGRPPGSGRAAGGCPDFVPGVPTHPRRAGDGGIVRARERVRPVVTAPPPLRPTPKRGRASRAGAVAKPVGIGLAALRDGLCRWPLWGDDERPREGGLYCGAAAEACGTYCAGHARLAYIAPAAAAAASGGIGRAA